MVENSKIFKGMAFSSHQGWESVIVDAAFESFGWKTYLQQRRGTSKITINKCVAVGAGLEKGQFLYCYLARDKAGRPVVVVYLDGKERNVAQR